MPAQNPNALPIVAAKLSVAPFAAGIPMLADDNSNADVVTQYLEANFTYTRLASIIDGQISQNLADNTISVDADECDTGNIYEASEPAINASATWYESQNLDALSIILGTPTLDVAGTPVVGFNQLASNGSWSFANAIKLSNQNFDGSINNVTQVSWSVDGVLLAADYTVSQDSNGDTVVTVFSGGSATTAAQDLTITYDYTPTDKRYGGLKVTTKELPRLIVRFETCPDADGKINYHYLVNSTLTGELLTVFVDPVRAGDITGSSVEFETKKGGFYVFDNERF